MTEHTALPWTFEKEENLHQYIKTPFYIRSGKYLVAVGGLQAEATISNARFIVTACNNYEKVLACLKDLLDSSIYADGEGLFHISQGGIADFDHRALIERCNEAIRNAEEA